MLRKRRRLCGDGADHQWAGGRRLNPAESSISVERWLARAPLPRPWVLAIIWLVLLALPVVAIMADNALPALLHDRRLHYLFFAPFMVVYILAAPPPLERSRRQVAQALRPLVQLDDEVFDAVVAHACRRRPRVEALGALAGIAFVLLISGWPALDLQYPVTTAYVYAANIVMFAAIGWIAAVIFEITRLTDDLLRQPIRVNILDVSPFEAVGRQSLLLALVFLGGTVLSLVFVVSPGELEGFLSWQNIVIYSVMIALSVVAFFLGMYSTHRLLSVTKRGHMTQTQLRLSAAYDRFHHVAEATPDAQAAATELMAWTAAKEELNTARTWPYNTGMLRTLVASGLAPLAVGLARVLAVWFAAQ